MLRQVFLVNLSALFLSFLWFSCNALRYMDDTGAPNVILSVGTLKGSTQNSWESPPWNGILSAENFGDPCIGFDFVTEEHLQGSEDCLFINVFVPAEIGRNGEKLPVLTWIHGGGFRAGSSDGYGPRYFMDEDVILVSMNYRLALKWIQKHIGEFGGDKNRVTIFGESSGGPSVHYLTLSPLSKGLFNGAISMSGIANAPWSFKTSNLNATATITKEVGCPSPYSNTSAMLECLKKVDAVEILVAQRNYHVSFGRGKGKVASYTPTIDIGRPSTQRFLPASPTEIMYEGNFNPVNMMIGIVRDEGVFIFGAYLVQNLKKMSELNWDFDQFAPDLFDYRQYFLDDYLHVASAKIMDYYFNNDTIGPHSAEAVFDLYADTFFVVPGRQAIRAHSKKGPVYNYCLDFKPDYTIFDMYAGTRDFEKYITHADDLSLFFNFDGFLPEGTSEDFIKVSKGAVKAWVHFAANGYPISWGKENAVWEPANPSKWFSMDIEPRMRYETDEFSSRMAFWDDLLKKYGIGWAR